MTSENFWSWLAIIINYIAQRERACCHPYGVSATLPLHFLFFSPWLWACIQGFDSQCEHFVITNRDCWPAPCLSRPPQPVTLSPPELSVTFSPLSQSFVSPVFGLPLATKRSWKPQLAHHHCTSVFIPRPGHEHQWGPEWSTIHHLCPILCTSSPPSLPHLPNQLTKAR